MTYLNTRGEPMAESAAPVAFASGTSAGGETLTAPAGPSAVDSGGGPGDLMIAGQGDQTFYVRDRTDLVQAGGGLSGVKTVVAYTPYALAPNLQNLDVTGSYAFAVGNGQANLIIGHSDHQSLYGGPGDDVLVGAGNGTSYLIAAGEGQDVIYGFAADDTVRLIGSSFRSFGQLQGAMRQQGADVVIQIDPSETLTLRNVSLGQLGARNFLLPLDRGRLGGQTFDDEFNGLALYDPATRTGAWRPDFGSDPTKQDDYRLSQNGEQQVYVTPSFQGLGDHALGYNPFSVSGGVLTITAQPIPVQDQPAAFGASYASGMINTRSLFAQKYGYFEIRMAMPDAKGAWPAFWMVPDPNGAGIEADIGENIAIDPQVDHVRAYGDGQVLGYAEALKTGDHTGFHTYGLLWTPQTLTWYYDDVAVYQAATPASWNQPMYMIVNLAVGGYGGQPVAAEFPASMQVDYVRAYALADGSSQVVRGYPTVTFGTAGNDSLVAPAGGGQQLESLAGADTLVGANDGPNTLYGGDGADSIVCGAQFDLVNGNLGQDTIVSAGAVADVINGGQGADRIDAGGSSGANIINGNLGDDVVIGGSGADWLRGGQGDDRLIGGAGDDTLFGDRGHDTVSGGAGADVFRHFGAAGVSLVTDFSYAEGDRVRLEPGSQWTVVQAGADVDVNLAGGGQLVLQNVDLSRLGSDWIGVA